MNYLNLNLYYCINPKTEKLILYIKIIRSFCNWIFKREEP
jgi:hypothetical protein